MTASDPALAAGIEDRLDSIIRLLTALVTKDMEKKESVLALTAAGLAPKEIGDIFGLTGNQVVIVYDAKQSTGKKAKPAKAKAKSSGG